MTIMDGVIVIIDPVNIGHLLNDFVVPIKSINLKSRDHITLAIRDSEASFIQS
jgi:hypothetical protein